MTEMYTTERIQIAADVPEITVVTTDATIGAAATARPDLSDLVDRRGLKALRVRKDRKVRLVLPGLRVLREQ